ncbi:uncharacterized protein [Antedon mediterranea]|uniref:uncharacterized protein n=1 Tax=Antedon mediterranea TaxID=105859 RepID=UPI003AF4A3A5
MSRKSDKNGTLVGEKSQAVYSANWKLDTLLGKRLSMLDTSKRRVSHSITIDQRIVNKRFQLKLHQSKVYNARMTGNRDLLRQLTHRDNFSSFNTSVDQDDKYAVNFNRNSASAPPGTRRRSESNDYQKEPATRDISSTSRQVESEPELTTKRESALKALQRRMSSRNMLIHKTPSELLKVSSGQLPVIECEDEDSSEVKSKKKVVTFPQESRTYSKEDLTDTDYQTTVDCLLAKRRQRPVTAATRSVSHTKELEHGMVADLNNNNYTLSTTKPKRRPKSSTVPGFETTSTRSISSSDKQLKSIDASVLDRKTNMNDSRVTENGSPQFKITPSSTNEKSSEEVLPITIQESSIKHLEQLETKLQSKRKSISTNPKNKLIPSIFGEQRKVTIFDVNQERIDSSNFSCRFDNFFESLKGLENDQDHCADYYTMRLQQTCNKNVSRQEHQQTEEEKLHSIKSVGNVSAKNMTFNELNHDFSDYPSQYFLNPRSSSNVARNAGSFSVKNAWDAADQLQ